MIEHNEFTLDIAVLGGGFAGVYAAQRLQRYRQVKVGLIAEENYMVFQPMLPEVVGASLSPRHVANPLRLLCQQAQVFRGKVTRIDWPNRRLTLHAGPFAGDIVIRFTHLVLALGAVIDLSGIPGMPEHSYLMQNVGDAMLLRSTLFSRIEEASLELRPEVRQRLLSFVVVGGGYSGVETAGHILDLLRSLRGVYRQIQPAEWQVFLIHSHDHLLPTLSRKLGDYCAQKLTERGLKLMLNQRVKAVTANCVYLQDGSMVQANTVVSTVGNAPHPLVTELCLANGFLMERGRMVTEPTCQVAGQSQLWAAGDCAAVPYVLGGYCPATAQFAMRQGALLAENLLRSLQAKPLQPFHYKARGEMASIGHHSAVADVLGLQFSGFFAWWLWRTFYLAKLPRLDRKVRVVLDWTLDLFFRRDITLLNPRYSFRLKEIYLERGDILFHKGEPAFSFYIVKSGSMELYDAKELVETITEGGHFGERALLEDGYWLFEARAKEPSTLVSIPAAVFHQMVRGPGSLNRFFRKSATKHRSREIVEAITRKIPLPVQTKTVGELMQRDLRTMTPDMTVREALGILKTYPHSSYPVVDATGRILGVLQRDDIYELMQKVETTPETQLKAVPLGTLPILREEITVAEVISRLIRNGAHKALVVDEAQHLQGILTMMDLVVASESQR